MRFDAWKDEPYESLEDAFPDIQADFEDYYYREKQMAALFPTFTNAFRITWQLACFKTVLKFTQLTISCGGRLK
jgi:hypothetical protein